jgi:transcriptional regulator with XRE-family HTH domain
MPVVPPLLLFGDNMPVGYLRNLKTIRKARNLTQQQLADILGIEQPSIQRYESGRSPSLAQAIEIADALGVSLNELVSAGEVVRLGPELRVKGEVQAGVWRDAIEWPETEWLEYIGRADVSADARHRFGLRVVGDSMNEIYPHGTILDCVSVFGRAEIQSGKRVIVIRQRDDFEFEATVKEFHIDQDGREWLRPRSNHPAFQQWQALDEEEAGIIERRITAIVVAAITPE